MPRKRNNRPNVSALRMLKRSLNFHKLKAPSHPPEFTAVPWYNLVLRIQDPPTIITKNSIRDNLFSQLGIISLQPTQIDFRFQAVFLWGAMTTSNILNPVSLAVIDPISLANIASTGAGGISTVLIDYPDYVNRARVGFKYSEAQSKAVMSSGSTVPVFNTTGAGGGSVMYIHLNWRTQAKTPLLPLLDSADAEGDWQLPPKYNAVAPGQIPGPYAHCTGQLRHV